MSLRSIFYFILFSAFSALIVIICSELAYPHPGKLDNKLGHFVKKAVVSKQGLVFKQGTYHSHDASKRFGSVSLIDGDKLEIGEGVDKITVEIPAGLDKQGTEKFISETLDRYLGSYIKER